MRFLISVGFAKRSTHPTAKEHPALPIEDQTGHSGPFNEPPRSDPPATRSVSTRELVLIFVALAVALVLGYLFLNKLVDMSQEEDCALAHRHNC